jgi:hypothetical protein
MLEISVGPGGRCARDKCSKTSGVARGGDDSNLYELLLHLEISGYNLVCH